MNAYVVMVNPGGYDAFGGLFAASSRGRARAYAAGEFDLEFTTSMSIRLLRKDVSAGRGYISDRNWPDLWKEAEDRCLIGEPYDD